MKKKQFDEMKKTFNRVNKFLKEERVKPEERLKLEEIKDRLAGSLLTTWLPLDWGRRAIMIVIGICGICGLMLGNALLSLSLFLLPFFSPRIVGESVYAIGRFLRAFKDDSVH